MPRTVPALLNRCRSSPSRRACCSASSAALQLALSLAGQPAGPPTTPSSWCGCRRSSPPAPRRRARHQRVPHRRPRAGRAARGVRRRDRPSARADHRRRRGPAGRPRRRSPPSTPRSPTTPRDRAGPRQQPPGLPGRREYLDARPSARHCAPRRSRSSTSLVDANAERAEDELDGQHPFGCSCCRAGRAGRCCGWVNRELARRFRRRVNVGHRGRRGHRVVVLTLVALVVASGPARATTTTCATAATGRRSTGRGPDRRPTTPRPTRACG